MRSIDAPPRVRASSASRAFQAGLPVAVAGSLTLLLGATPAHAADPRTDMSDTATAQRTLRALPPAALRVATEAPESHVVVPGDSVSSIAGAYGLRTPDVLALNGLDWSSIIQPGQVLILSAPAAVVAPPASVAPEPAPSASGAYVVVAGDTVSSIAAAHGLSVAEVLSANGFEWSSIIYPGQSIIIQGAVAPSAPAPAEQQAAPVTPPAPVAPAAGSHTVSAGDSISSIAAANGVSIDALFTANGLGWSSIIYPGEVLVIPGAATFELVASAAPMTAAPATAGSSDLDAEQIASAQIIIAVGRELEVSDRGIAIALGTAMQESWLRNLDWGDRDSLGLFQQRPSTGWGSEAEVRDAARSARAFYGGPSDPNGYTTQGLLDIAGWEAMSFADAAQAVQISAYPERYAQWEQPAYAWLAAHG